MSASKPYSMYVAHKMTHTFTNFQADFVDNGKGAHAEQGLYGKILTRSPQSHHFVVRVLPLGWRKSAGKFISAGVLSSVLYG